MAVVQHAFTRWQIVQVHGEVEREPTTVNVLSAKIDQTIANSLIRELNSKEPLPLLGHVKRIRRSMKEGDLELSIILCTLDTVDPGKEIVLPTAVSEIVARYCLQTFLASVAGQPARTRDEWETQCQLWPTSFHPNSGKSGANFELSQGDADTMCHFMEIAVEQARLGHKDGQPANGAIIVDPASGAVIARGCDKTGGWGTSLCTSSHSSPGHQTEDNLKANCGWHPLQHAIMEAIQMASERDRSLWPAENSKALEGTRRGKEFYSAVRRKRPRSCDETEVSNSAVDADAILLTDNSRLIGDASSFETARPYLCTDFDLYVTREPCAMCAMAMVHQRIRRVIYGIPNAHFGALGSRYRLHGLASLNHHYRVFRISLCEADLL